LVTDFASSGPDVFCRFQGILLEAAA